MRWCWSSCLSILLLAGVYCLRMPRLTAPLRLSRGSKLLVSASSKPAARFHSPHKTKKPIILLNIESLNAGSDLKWAQEKYWHDAELIKNVASYERCPPRDVTFSPTVVEKINKWSKQADIRWVTTWTNCNLYCTASKMGLKEFRVVAYGDREDSRYEEDNWKVTNAQTLANKVGPDRLIIWVDGDIIYRIHEGQNEGEEGITHVSPVLVRPNTVYVFPHARRCLLPEHLDLVDKYLANPELAKGKSIYQMPQHPGDYWNKEKPENNNHIKIFTRRSPAATAIVYTD